MKHLWRFVACGLACVPILALLIWSCFEYGQFDHSKPGDCNGRKRMPQDGSSINKHPDHGFYGDKDIYGMGTRAGIYSQWLASWIATIFLDLEHTRLTAAFMCFEIATLAAFFFLIFSPGCVFTVECLIIMYFLFGGIAAVLGPDLVAGVAGRRITQRLATQDFIVMLLVCVVSTVASWFWIRFARVGDNVDFAATPGGTSLFILAHVRNEHIQAASIAMATFCVVLALYTFDKVVGLAITKTLELPEELPSLVLAFLVIANAAIFRSLGLSATNPLWPKFVVDWACLRLPWEESWSGRWSMLRERIEDLCPEWRELRTASNRHGAQRATRSNAAKLTNEKKEEYHAYGVVVKVLSIGVCFIAFALAVTGIELTLFWNQVWDRYSILTFGQIIPLTGGITVLVTVLWDTVNGPLKYGAGYRRIKLRLRQLELDDIPRGIPLFDDAAGRGKFWKRAQSAIMTPSRHFRERGDGPWSRQQDTLLQNLVKACRSFASKNKAENQDTSPLLQDQHSGIGETLSLTEGQTSSSEVVSAARGSQQLELPPNQDNQRNRESTMPATGDGTSEPEGIRTALHDSSQQWLSSPTPTFYTAQERNDNSKDAGESTEMSALYRIRPRKAES